MPKHTRVPKIPWLWRLRSHCSPNLCVSESGLNLLPGSQLTQSSLVFLLSTQQLNILHLKLSQHLPSLTPTQHTLQLWHYSCSNPTTKIPAPPRTDAKPVRASSHPTWQLGGVEGGREEQVEEKSTAAVEKGKINPESTEKIRVSVYRQISHRLPHFFLNRITSPLLVSVCAPQQTQLDSPDAESHKVSGWTQTLWKIKSLLRSSLFSLTSVWAHEEWKVLKCNFNAI